jgi:hypothetical protein
MENLQRGTIFLPCAQNSCIFGKNKHMNRVSPGEAEQAA